MGSTQDSYLGMTLAEPTESVLQLNATIEEISMDSQNAALQSAAIRQHSLNMNMMAAFAQVAQATNSAAALPFLSAATGVIPNPNTTFVNFPAGTSTTGSLDQYTAQPIVYPSAYLAQSVCSCGCSVQSPCALHRYTNPAFLAATTLATALESRASTVTRMQSQPHSMTPSLSTLAASNVNVNIPPPIAQLPPTPLNLPALPPTMRTMGSSSRGLKRPTPYQLSQPTPTSNTNLQPYNNNNNGNNNNNLPTHNSTSTTGFRGPKIRRIASFDSSSNEATQSRVDTNEHISQNVVPMSNVVPPNSLFNQRPVDLAEVAASIEGVLQSTAQSLPQTPFPPCTICAGCQTRLPPHPPCGCHHHHHCVNHHTICAACSAQTYGSSSSSAMTSNAAANYLASISTTTQPLAQHNLPFATVPRQPEINSVHSTLLAQRQDINPVHSVMLAQRQAQQERDQQTTNNWYQRQFPNQSFVGFDVVTRRLPQPVMLVPRIPHTMMDLSIFVLHPTDAVLSGAAGITATHQHASAEPQPVGASLEQIKKFSSVLAYVKDPDVPEQERERCTICLVDFETDDDVRSLQCSHMFHIDCIDRWLVYNKKCPICRVDMDKVDMLLDKAPPMLNMIEAAVPSHSSHYVRAQR